MANRTRSPLFEVYTRHYSLGAELSLIVSSAGVKGVAVNANGTHDRLVDPYVQLDLSQHRPRFVSEEDAEADLILGVNPRVKQLFDELFPHIAGKSDTVKGFLGLRGEIIDAHDRTKDGDHLPPSYDPWYDKAAGILKGSEEAYRRMVDEIRMLSEQVVGKLVRERAAAGI